MLQCLQAPEHDCAVMFSDGSSTSFYINANNTKQCPTMDGILEELRAGLASLNDRRETEKARVKEELAAISPDAENHLSPTEKKQVAVELLMRILLATHLGKMQQCACGASAAANAESMILCRPAWNLHAPPVSMREMLVGSLTDNND